MSKRNRFEGKTCYMCDAPATSDEHAPPKCLFPETKDLDGGEDLRKNLIKVPACNKHNSEKSDNDTYLFYVLCASVTSNRTGRTHSTTKLLRSIQRNPSLMLRMAKDSTQVWVRDNETGILEATDALVLDPERFQQSFDSLGRAIYFHHFNKKWNNAIESTPHFVRNLTTANAQSVNEHFDVLDIVSDIMFKDLPHYGDNPQVFTYQMLNGSEQIHMVIRLNFYGNSIATLLFKN